MHASRFKSLGIIPMGFSYGNCKALIHVDNKSKETESKSWIHYSLMGFEDKCITFNQEKQFYM